MAIYVASKSTQGFQAVSNKIALQSIFSLQHPLAKHCVAVCMHISVQSTRSKDIAEKRIW
jgi:hypothetical protein